MGKRTSYVPGTFSWVDLATTDAEAALAFYTELFGWEAEHNDAGDGMTYTMLRLGGDAVAGLFGMSEEMRATGVPPNWTSYVTVDDADAAVARAREHGGEAIDEAFDVMDVGRMAVLKDPQGAVFAVWEPRARIGAELVNEVGALCNNELATTDLGAARSFYEGLFGWTTQDVPTGPDGPEMAAAFVGETINANLSVVQGGAPPHWRPYFVVESAEDAAARIGALGGQVVFGPLAIPAGAFALALDPQGALFGVFAGETDP